MYFIIAGRAKVLRQVEILDAAAIKPTIFNYESLFNAPTAQQLAANQARRLTLDLVELGRFECFGEDSQALQNFMLKPY